MNKYKIEFPVIKQFTNPLSQLTSSNGAALLFSSWDACNPKQGNSFAFKQNVTLFRIWERYVANLLTNGNSLWTQGGRLHSFTCYITVPIELSLRWRWEHFFLQQHKMIGAIIFLPNLTCQWRSILEIQFNSSHKLILSMTFNKVAMSIFSNVFALKLASSNNDDTNVNCSFSWSINLILSHLLYPVWI